MLAFGGTENIGRLSMAMLPFDPFSLSRWDPWSEMTTLRDAMTRLLDSSFVRPTMAFGSSAGMDVPLDLIETENEYRVQAHVPGMRPEDIHISVHNNVVTLEGERREARDEKEEGRRVYTEHRYGRFSRSFTLPMAVDAGKCKADFRDGVLSLTMPKLETARPRQIPIGGQRTLEPPGETGAVQVNARSPRQAAGKTSSRAAPRTTGAARSRTTARSSNTSRSSGRRRTRVEAPTSSTTGMPGEGGAGPSIRREPVNMPAEQPSTRQDPR